MKHPDRSDQLDPQRRISRLASVVIVLGLALAPPASAARPQHANSRRRRLHQHQPWLGGGLELRQESRRHPRHHERR